MNSRFEAPRGMRDFYPEDIQTRNAIFNAWMQAALQFGFSQYDACVVETLDLLKHKSGQEIIEQVYAFKDKSGRELALRPEMTPTLARMIAARRGSLAFPLKWFAVAQCFRYERTSRGRKREHYQWNLDIIGEPALSAEAEIIACALHSLSLMGFEPKDITVHLSSRALLSDMLRRFNIPSACHHAVFLALDKTGKLDEEDIKGLLEKAGLDTRAIDAVFEIASIQSLDAASDILPDTPPSLTDMRSLMDSLNQRGVADKVGFDITIVRGLDYYTGIVFEAFDAQKDYRAVFGGGRYDRLLQDVGGGELTAVGLGFGDVVVAELLENKNISARHEEKIDLAVGYMQNGQQSAASGLALKFRAEGKRVDLALHPEKARNFFARVGSGRFLNAVFIGPDDMERGTVRIKDLVSRTENEVKLGS